MASDELSPPLCRRETVSHPMIALDEERSSLGLQPLLEFREKFLDILVAIAGMAGIHDGNERGEVHGLRPIFGQHRE